MKQLLSQLHRKNTSKIRKKTPESTHKTQNFTVLTQNTHKNSEIRHINYRPPRGNFISTRKNRKISSKTQTNLSVIGENVHEEPSISHRSLSNIDARQWEIGDLSRDSVFSPTEMEGNSGKREDNRPSSWYSVAVNPVVASQTTSHFAMSHTGFELEVDSHSVTGRSHGSSLPSYPSKPPVPARKVTIEEVVGSRGLKGRKVMDTLIPGVRFYMQPVRIRRPNHFLADKE